MCLALPARIVALADAMMVTVAGPGSESETRIAWPGCPVEDDACPIFP